MNSHYDPRRSQSHPYLYSRPQQITHTSYSNSSSIQVTAEEMYYRSHLTPSQSSNNNHSLPTHSTHHPIAQPHSHPLALPPPQPHPQPHYHAPSSTSNQNYHSNTLPVYDQYDISSTGISHQSWRESMNAYLNSLPQTSTFSTGHDSRPRLPELSNLYQSQPQRRFTRHVQQVVPSQSNPGSLSGFAPADREADRLRQSSSRPPAKPRAVGARSAAPSFTVPSNSGSYGPKQTTVLPSFPMTSADLWENHLEGSSATSFGASQAPAPTPSFREPSPSVASSPSSVEEPLPRLPVASKKRVKPKPVPIPIQKLELPKDLNGQVYIPSPEGSDYPDLAYGVLTQNRMNPPSVGLDGFDDSTRPQLQEEKLRSENDMYTPRWTRGSRTTREGWCSSCGSWHKLKNSAFNFHQLHSHGVSSATGQRFPPPSSMREVIQSKKSKRIEGHCDNCNEWILILVGKRKPSWGNWWHHCHTCQLNRGNGSRKADSDEEKGSRQRAGRKRKVNEDEDDQESGYEFDDDEEQESEYEEDQESEYEEGRSTKGGKRSRR